MKTSVCRGFSGTLLSSDEVKEKRFDKCRQREP